jgi:imidazoleglycerol phosphate synthase, cyclase subunit
VRSTGALRVVPCLDVDSGRVVKGVRFLNLVDSGDPVELASRYEAEGADEIAFLDISATIEGRRTALESIRRVREAIGIPLMVGGGVKSVEDAGRLLEAGADRVGVNSAAVRDPGLIGELARLFGVQCVVLAIDARRIKSVGGDARRARSVDIDALADTGWEVVVEAGRRAVPLEAAAWAREGAGRGAGEILLTSMDRDGTGSGYDLALLSAVVAASGVPVVASGGASRPEHFIEGARAGARALLAAGSFHRGELSIDTVKRSLAEAGMEVRL